MGGIVTLSAMCGANDEGTSLKRVCCIERAAKGKVIFQVIGVVKSNKSLSFVSLRQVQARFQGLSVV